MKFALRNLSIEKKKQVFMKNRVTLEEERILQLTRALSQQVRTRGSAVAAILNNAAVRYWILHEYPTTATNPTTYPSTLPPMFLLQGRRLLNKPRFPNNYFVANLNTGFEDSLWKPRDIFVSQFYSSAVFRNVETFISHKNTEFSNFIKDNKYL